MINRHPQVRMSLVRPKRSPITGSIVIADVVLKIRRQQHGRRSSAKSKAISSNSAARRCRATKCRRRSASLPRSMLRRAANWRGVMAKKDHAKRKTAASAAQCPGHRREPRFGARHCPQARRRGLLRHRAGAQRHQGADRRDREGKARQARLAAFRRRSISARSTKYRNWCARCGKNSAPLFGLVNNAALGLDGALSLMHNSQIEEMLRVNTHSPIVLSKYVVRSMMSERSRPYRQCRFDHRLHRL